MFSRPLAMWLPASPGNALSPLSLSHPLPPFWAIWQLCQSPSLLIAFDISAPSPSKTAPQFCRPPFRAPCSIISFVRFSLKTLHQPTSFIFLILSVSSIVPFTTYVSKLSVTIEQNKTLKTRNLHRGKVYLGPQLSVRGHLVLLVLGR